MDDILAFPFSLLTQDWRRRRPTLTSRTFFIEVPLPGYQGLALCAHRQIIVLAQPEYVSPKAIAPKMFRYDVLECTALSSTAPA